MVFGSCVASTCACDPGFAGDQCQFQPGIPECDLTLLLCDDTNACTSNNCNTSAANGGTCFFIDNPPCNDNDVCTIDECDKLKGCVFTPISCDDNNLCTIDSCDKVKGCLHTNVTCSQLVDICHDAHCDKTQNVSNQCVRTEKVCPHPLNDNCTNTACFLPVKPNAQNKGCRMNKNDPRTPKVGEDTDNSKIPLCHSGGCEVEKLDCNSNIGAIAGGLAAGAIAGIVIAAAAVLAAACAGGAAAAAATQTGSADDSKVFSNPVYNNPIMTSAGLG